MSTQVINCTLYADNPYQTLLYSAISGKYQPVKGTIDNAIDALSEKRKVLLHINWEEHIIRAAPTAAEAQAATDYFIRCLGRFVKMGGRVAWTVHNALPHELQHPDIFVGLRKRINALADRIIVHNTEAISVLASQVDLDRRKIFFLAHPSYLGHYESEDVTLAGLEAPVSNTILSFGKMRRYKGFESLFHLLPEDFLKPLGGRLKFSGNPIPGDAYVDELKALSATRLDVDWDIRNIPDEEVPDLLRGAACVVLPYERFLTSGVALLCLSIGALVVAPATRQLREVIPVKAQELLFDPDSDDDFRRAISQVLSMPAEERLEWRHMYYDRAKYLHPKRISRQLGLLLDELSQAPVKA